MDGVVYIAFNKHKKVNHIHELLYSLKTLKNKHPEVPTTVFSDEEIQSSLIDNLVKVPINSFRKKQDFLPLSPYDTTLYMDTDTAVVGDLSDLFRITERFDLAACFDYLREDKNKAAGFEEYGNIPTSFSELGGGVIIFKKSKITDNFFKVWKKNYSNFCRNTEWTSDQQTFRQSIWECTNLNFYVLPPEFNLRTQSKRESCRDRFPIEDKIYHWHNMHNVGLKYQPYNY